MNLYRMLLERQEKGHIIRVGLIGAGKFGTMFVSQALRTPGIHLVAVADLNPERARRSMSSTGWPEEQIDAGTMDEALRKGKTFITDSSEELINSSGMDIIIEATGIPAVGIRHALSCIRAGKHVVMVNVEGDALAGPLLAKKAAEAGVIYSLAYGDQPALIAEQVDWARACGLEVVAAGKGTKYLPEYHYSTPDTVWHYYGLTPEEARVGGMNSKMFNSFLDGTKSAIEMAAVANATGLLPPSDGLQFPPCGIGALADILKPAEFGGILEQKGMVEVISSLHRDGSNVPRDLRWGVFVSFEAPTDYVKRCFSEYGLVTDETGRYSALYRPYHLIGLELGISVASIALRKEPTGCASGFRGDVVSIAKKDLSPGEILDGEGGYTVWGKLFPARDSLSKGLLPLGLAQGIKVVREVPKGTPLSWNDVALSLSDDALIIRKEMEKAFSDAL
ncbi:MAG: Gfo/Idh/MocA family oxidoreductase [Synergistales bacterium]|nr:Gfo/Idh/MocA family oxidoreductase [Synergistales bacterium]